MYTAISVRTPDGVGVEREGHAYDISRGGVCFELDEAIEAGTPVEIRLTLPEWLRELSDGQAERGAGVLLRGTVVWADSFEPGPVRMAAVFTSFENVAGRERFIRTLDNHSFAAAA